MMADLHPQGAVRVIGVGALLAERDAGRRRQQELGYVAAADGDLGRAQGQDRRRTARRSCGSTRTSTTWAVEARKLVGPADPRAGRGTGRRCAVIVTGDFNACEGKRRRTRTLFGAIDGQESPGRRHVPRAAEGEAAA